MTLSKESEDAFRQCLQILASRLGPDERSRMIRNAEVYIAQGRWIPAFHLAEIAILFFPNDNLREESMKSKMLTALETGELQSTGPKRTFLSSHLSAWPECPPVPKNSPLRYWLPEWMQETESPIGTAPRDAPSVLRQQEEKIIDWLEENGNIPEALPKRENGKKTVKALARAALNGKGLFEKPTAFNKAWERLRSFEQIREVE